MKFSKALAAESLAISIFKIVMDRLRFGLYVVRENAEQEETLFVIPYKGILPSTDEEADVADTEFIIVYSAGREVAWETIALTNKAGSFNPYDGGSPPETIEFSLGTFETLAKALERIVKAKVEEVFTEAQIEAIEEGAAKAEEVNLQEKNETN